MDSYFFRTCFHIRRHAKHNQGRGSIPGSTAPIPTLPSTYSVHDFHNYGFHGTGVTPGLHFHLAASINGETGKSSKDFPETVDYLPHV